MRLITALALLAVAVGAQASELRNLRLAQGPDATRAVLEFDAPAVASMFFLSNPDRLVIDFNQAQRAVGAHLADGAGLVQDVRSGPLPGGGLRVVLDLKARASARHFSLAAGSGYGYRMIVDLTPRPPVVAAAAAAAAPALPLAPPPRVASLAPRAIAPAAPLPAPRPPAADQAPPPTAYAPPVIVEPPPPRRAAAKAFVVAVDAGHGGDDPGAQSPNGLNEKDVTLAIARRLAERIDQQAGMRAVLTRDGDYYIGLRERTEKAREAQADLFVSIHANAYRDASMSGTAVYVLSDHGATTEQARWIANRENSADLVGGVDLHDKDDKLAAVLIDISQSATMAASFDLGNRMLESLSRINSLQKPQVQQAGFMVLKSPDIPSVLVETAFLSNPREERMLRDPQYQDRFADSIFDGVRGYFLRYRPSQQVVASESGEARSSPRSVPVRLLRAADEDPHAGN